MKKKKYYGYAVNFPIGLRNDSVQFIITTDDGTWGDHLIIKFNDVPCGVIPIVNKKGLKKMIDVLKDVYKEYADTQYENPQTS